MAPPDMLGILITQLNEYARDPKSGFWMAGLAREIAAPIVAAGRLDELLGPARIAVEHYAGLQDGPANP